MTNLFFFLIGVLFGCAAYTVGFLVLLIEKSIRFGPKPRPQPRDRLGRFASTSDAKTAALHAALRHDVEAKKVSQ